MLGSGWEVGPCDSLVHIILSLSTTQHILGQELITDQAVLSWPGLLPAVLSRQCGKICVREILQGKVVWGGRDHLSLSRGVTPGEGGLLLKLLSVLLECLHGSHLFLSRVVAPGEGGLHMSHLCLSRGARSSLCHLNVLAKVTQAGGLEPDHSLIPPLPLPHAHMPYSGNWLVVYRQAGGLVGSGVYHLVAEIKLMFNHDFNIKIKNSGTLITATTQE